MIGSDRIQRDKKKEVNKAVNDVLEERIRVGFGHVERERERESEVYRLNEPHKSQPSSHSHCRRLHTKTILI